MVTVRALTAKINADPTNFLKGVGQVNRGFTEIGEVGERNISAVRKLLDSLRLTLGQTETAVTDLSEVMASISKTVKGFAQQAGIADKSVSGLTTSATGLADALEGVDSAAAAADVSLDGLDAGAAAAGKSVASLGRAAAGTLPKIEALSGAVYDSAGIVSSADAGAAAFERLKLAAAEARASIRTAGGGFGGGFFGGGGGGRHGGGGGMGEPIPVPGTFGGGLKAGGGVAYDLAGAGAAITTILAAVTGKMAANFDNAMQAAKSNTTMTTADMASLRAQVLREMRTGSSSEDLIDAYKHAANLGFKGAGARQVLDVSNRFGIGTQTPIGEVSDVLSRFLNDYRMGSDMAPRVANTIHFAAAGSNMDPKDLERASSKSVGKAASYMGPEGFPDVLAAFSAIAKNLTPRLANTQISGLLDQIATPSPKAQKMAAALGIGKDFNAVGLRTEGLSGVIEKVKAAIDKLPEIEQAPARNALFNNKQGGYGAQLLTGSRNADYKHILNDPKEGTKAAFEGKIDAIDPNYNAQMKQTTQAFKALAGEIRSDFIPIGEKIGPLFLAAIPVIRETSNILKRLLDGFAGLPKPAQEAIVAFGGFKILTSFLPMLSGFNLLSEKTGVILRDLSKMLFGIGPAAGEGAAALSGPFVLGMAAVVATSAALVLAWKTDFGHIREVTAQVGASVMGVVNTQFGGVKKWFTANMPLIRETVHTVLTAMQTFWHDHGQRIMAIVRPLWALIKDTVIAALHIIEGVVKLAMDIINGHWSAAGADLRQILGSLWSWIKSAFSNGVKMIGNTLALVVSLVIDLGKRILEAALGVGKAIWQGIVNGIKAGIGHVQDAVAGLINGIPLTVRKLLGIASPSKVMHQLGLYTAAGMASGLIAGTPAVAAAADLLGKTVHHHIRKHMSEGQKEARAATQDIAKYRATGQYLAAGYSPSAARTAGSLHAVINSPSAQKAIALKQENAELVKSEQLWARYSHAVRAAQAELTALRHGSSAGGARAAGEFSMLPASAQKTLTDIQNKIKAQKDAHQANLETKKAEDALNKSIAEAKEHYLGSATAAQVDIIAIKAYGKALKDLSPAHQAQVKEMLDWTDKQKAKDKATKDNAAQMEVVAGLTQQANDDQMLLTATTDAQKWAINNLHVAYSSLPPEMQKTIEASTKIIASSQAIKDVTVSQTEVTKRLRDNLTDLIAKHAELVGKMTPLKAIVASLGIDYSKLTKEQQALLAQIVKQSQQNDALRKQQEQIAQVVGSVKDVWKNAFTDMMNHSKNFFASIVDGFKQMFQQIAAEYLADQVMQMLLGAIGGSSLQLAFGGNFPGRVTGGDMLGGQTYMVGENGPELFTPPMSGGRIIANDKLGGGGGDTYHIHVNAQGGGSREENRRAGSQVGAAVYDAMQRAKRRNGT